MEATTIVALIGVMLLSAALALPGLLAFTRNQHDEADTYLKMEAALKSQQERGESQARQMDTLRTELDETRRLLDGVQNEINTLRRGIALLLWQLEQAGLTPVWTPERTLQPGVTRRTLSKRLREQFSLSELRDLALELGAAPEAIGGNTPADYAAELVAWAERRKMLEELERLITEQRPG